MFTGLPLQLQTSTLLHIFLPLLLNTSPPLFPSSLPVTTTSSGRSYFFLFCRPMTCSPLLMLQILVHLTSFLLPMVHSHPLNPAFTSWLKKDRVCKIWINSSLSEDILPYTVGSSTSRDLWITLEKRFSATTRSHLLQLKAKLQSLKKGSLNMTQYLQLVKGTVDSLAAAGSPIDDIDFVAHVLNGLPSDYDAFATAIRVRSDPVTSEDLHGLLLSEEIALSSRLTPFTEPTNHAFKTSFSNNFHRPNTFNPTFNRSFNASSSSPTSNPNNHSNTRPSSQFYKSQSSNTSSFSPQRHSFRPNNFSNSRIVCQICDKPGHGALTCRHRLNNSYQGHIPPPKLTAYSSGPAYPSASTVTTNHPSSSTTTWYADSGATNHLTNDLSNLSLHNAYTGQEKVNVANGESLDIHHTGSYYGENPFSRPY